MLYASREYVQTLQSDELVLDTSCNICQAEVTEVARLPPEAVRGRVIARNRRRMGLPIKVASGARAAAAVALVLENMLVDPFGSLNYFQKFRHHGYPVCEDT